MDNLAVVCDKDGCNWKGTLRDYEDHIHGSICETPCSIMSANSVSQILVVKEQMPGKCIPTEVYYHSSTTLFLQRMISTRSWPGLMAIPHQEKYNHQNSKECTPREKYRGLIELPLDLM